MPSSTTIFWLVMCLPHLALAHYRFQELLTPSQSSRAAIRQPTIIDPMLDATSPLMRCNIHTPATETVTIDAGSNIGFKLDNVIFHPGPAALYLGKVPEGKSAAEWDGSGRSWFKIKNWGGVYDPVMWDFEVLNKLQVNATIPANTPSGEYLLRVEQIGLLIPQEPQYYVSCAQVRIVNGGTGKPEPLVEIPGYFVPDDPGLQLDIYHPVAGETYRVPGPDVWEG
ncbi:glycosyl hydrolase family 61-domain-containing protein [Ephemerocybe angulata]|uniref:AA9 family lytic polysaccharide monooxygenase n=1 Tax=Ephemerocybe angulata TaxID=980116 RepID=A0A8H6M149_9AGAR|nr:glycosyl hydrolase family 61-domain-containing protein [Tulosesus angulatus]